MTVNSLERKKTRQRKPHKKLTHRVISIVETYSSDGALNFETTGYNKLQKCP